MAGYHPSRRPVCTARDRPQIGTKTVRTSPEPISGLRLPRRGAQAGVGLPATGSSSRRSGGGLQNAEIAFLGGWYKLETPQPLVSSTQTSLGPSARTPADRGPWGFGKGVVSSDHRGGSWPLLAPSASTALGWAPWAGVRLPMHMNLPGNQTRSFSTPRAHSPCKIAPYPCKIAPTRC